MRTWDSNALSLALDRVGVQKGDTVLCHCSLFALGRPGGVRTSEAPEILLKTLLSHVGRSGTICVPTFTFAFCRGETYDPVTAPSEGMGMLSEAVRTHPAARRSRHPMQSISAIGPQADALCALDTTDAYGPGGVFESLVARDAVLLLLGCPVQVASLVHLAEQRVGVPYRYFKDFTAPYVSDDGCSDRTYRMYVRDMAIDPQLKLAPIEESLRAAGAWRTARLGGGQVSACSAQDFSRTAISLLRADPWTFTNRPPERENP